VARRVVRIGLWSLAGLAGLIIAAAAVFALSFDPNVLKPRIVAAVRQATGRELTLQGPIRLGLSLQPTLTARNVSLSNPPGFSRPDMATLRQVDVKVALLPLLHNRLEIERLVLQQPEIILETDGQGRPNWQFAPEPRAGAPATQPTEPGREHAATVIEVSDARIEDGTVTWRDGRTGRSAVISIAGLRAGAASPGGDIRLSMQASYQSTPFTLQGDVGGLPRPDSPQANTAWPVRAHLEAAGASLDLEGAIGQPRQARGYRLKLDAKVSDLARLAPFVPAASLPPLHDIGLSARLIDAGRPLPDLTALSLRIGRSDLSGIAAGLRLDKLDAVSDGPDQPLRISAEGSFNNAPASLAGSLGPPEMLLSGSGQVALSARALGSNTAINGTVTRLPDGRLSLQGTVTGDTIDLDTLLAAMPKAAPATPASVPTGTQSPPPNTAARTGVFPDTPIPFDRLRGGDADLRLNIAQVIWRGAAYHDVATRLELKNGNLRVDPFSAETPGGHVEGVLGADASQANPTVALRLRIPELAVQSLLTALRQPAFMTGNLQVVADMRGAGTTPHAIVASLDGSLEVTMAGGTLDNRMFGGALGSVLREANILDLVGRGGTSQVQCFAARMDANQGIATLRSLALVSSLLTLEGNGVANLGAETLDLHLLPQARVAGTALVIPLRVGGSLRSPTITPDPAAAVGQNAGTVASALVGKSNPLGIIAGALGAKQLLGGTKVECGRAGGTAATQPAPQRQPKLPNPVDALQQLFR
jgi:AsmA protein